MNLSEEAEMLAMIWEQSIAGRGDDVTDNYIKLFRDDQECADVAFAEEKVSISAAKAIWNRLRTASPNAFFYSEKNGSDSNTTNQVKCPSAKVNLALTIAPKVKYHYDGPQQTA